MTDENKGLHRPLNRRDFMTLIATVTAVGGSALAYRELSNRALTPAQSAELREVASTTLGKLPKRPLGTRMGGMQVTPIVISMDWDSNLYAPGLDAGINFVHKAGYWRELPPAFQGLDRESYHTDITVDSTPKDPDNEDQAYAQVSDSLNKNGLKYYDIFRAHYGWKTVDIYKNQRGTYRAFQRLKKEGKVKYFGVSQHDWVPYPEIISALIEDGVVDSMQVFCTYGTNRANLDIFEKAHRAGIGMTAMKIVQNGRGAMTADTKRQAELKAPGQVGRALIRQVLTTTGSDGKPIFDCCVSSLRNFDMFNENIGSFAAGAVASDGFNPHLTA